MTRGRRRLLFTIGSGATIFVVTMIVYLIVDSTVGVGTGPRWVEALAVAAFAGIGGTIFGLLFSGVREDGEDEAGGDRERRGRRGRASRTS